MRKLSKLIAVCTLAGICSAAQAKLEVPAIEDLPKLSVNSAETTACPRIQNAFTRAHYKIVNLDDEFADKVINQLLKMLDYNRNIYTASDVAEIRANKSRILDALKQCDMSYPFELYNASLEKRYLKYDYFLQGIKSDIDVESDDVVQLDRRKQDFPADIEHKQHLWKSELKNEFINQVLNGKTPEQAKERIRKRYEAALMRLAQANPDDAFSVFQNAFANSIDPHTSYLSPADTKSFEEDMYLSLEGIGAVLSAEDENTVIVSIIPGSPAEKSKQLKPKDRIIAVHQEDGTVDDIIGWRLTDVVKKIKGPKGSKVTLDIERPDGTSVKNLSVTLVREKVRLQEREAKAEIKTADDGSKIGVLSIKSFYSNLSQDIARELTKLESDKSVKAVVIDLRNNGGGLLPEAVNSTGLFINAGPVVVVRDPLGNQLVQRSQDEKMKYKGPLVVLINGLSASSSEIMAAALRDYGRALLVGSNTFGKGTVQQSRPLARPYDFIEQELGTINYTIAKFYRINGGSTQLKGVAPDIALPSMVDDTEFGERNEPNALEWDEIGAVKYVPYLNINAFLPSLKQKHEARIANDPVFKSIAEELEKYRKVKNEPDLTVNLEKRRQMQKDDDAFTLKNINVRLKAMGKDPVKSAKDLPDDFEYEDFLLTETLNIASDYADLVNGSVKKIEDGRIAANQPIFTQYAPPLENKKLAE
ncbi:MAG TPA: tail-specific protease [Succinivibrionaceae bacterium]|nr:tail-specific protease [Succinivibrionaceae bacterium]